MQQNFNEIKYIFPKPFKEKNFLNQVSDIPFSDAAINFLHALSVELNSTKNIRSFPDVATFAFFCRKSNIVQLKKRFQNPTEIRLGRGIVFHITPSNVPVNFAYSLVSGILSGNNNIVRVPSKSFEQVDIICEAIERVQANVDFEEWASKIVLVKYDRQSDATNYFSSICDVRIIWGGDDSIAQIRESRIPPRAFDVTFADRYSICIINAATLIREKEVDKIAVGFFNDTYLFDQNACSAPHLLIWVGTLDCIDEAKRLFWDKLSEIVTQKYEFQSIMAVDKLVAFYSQALCLENIKKTSTSDNKLWRVQLEALPKNIDEFRCACGYFSEFHASSLNRMKTIINRKYQTLAYYGFSSEELKKFIKQNTPSGIDRIVPIGRTTDFSLNWDGFNLIDTLSRKIDFISE